MRLKTLHTVCCVKYLRCGFVKSLSSESLEKKKTFASCDDDELILMFLKKKRRDRDSGFSHEQPATRRISWVDPGVETVS